jgi:signal transduction histidine kinase
VLGRFLLRDRIDQCTRAVNNLSSTESDTLVELAFEDHGRGMSETELDTLFQEFEQVLDDEENQATGLFKEREKGGLEPVSLGLGLAMTARFVKLNCG